MRFAEITTKIGWNKFMRSTEAMMKEMTRKQFIEFLEKNAEHLKEYDEEVGGRYFNYYETETLRKEFIVNEDGRIFWWVSPNLMAELLDDEVEEIEEEEEQKGMTISKLYDAGIIDDSTEIIVRNENFGVLARGNWYMDNILEYMKKELEGFTWQDDGKVYADIKEVEE